MKSNTSFSLIELLVVLAAFSIVLFIGLPSFAFFERTILKQEVHKLFIAFSYLQQKALAANKKQTLSFDCVKQMYHYASLTGKTCTCRLPNTIIFGFLSGAKGPPSSPTKIINKSITFASNHVTFYPNATISPGTIYLITKKRSVMMALTSPISQVSYIRMYRYESNQWHHM